MPTFEYGLSADDVENINHRYSDTIIYLNGEWVYLRGALTRTVFSYYRVINPETLEWEERLYTLTRNTPGFSFSSKSPEMGFYNDLVRGVAILLSRNPTRQYKHTITTRVAPMHNAINVILPGAFGLELAGTTEPTLDVLGRDRGGSYLRWLAILNNKTPREPFDNAVKLVDEGKMLSCAFQKRFMVSAFPQDPDDDPSALLLWYDQFVIGRVSIRDNSIICSKLLLVQEIKDVLRDQRVTTWRVSE